MQGSVFFVHNIHIPHHPQATPQSQFSRALKCVCARSRVIFCVCLKMGVGLRIRESRKIGDGRWVRPFYQKWPGSTPLKNTSMYGINVNEKRVMFLILDTKTYFYFPWSSFLLVCIIWMPNAFPNILSSVELSRRGIYPWNATPTSKFICIRWWYQ